MQHGCHAGTRRQQQRREHALCSVGSDPPLTPGCSAVRSTWQACRELQVSGLSRSPQNKTNTQQPPSCWSILPPNHPQELLHKTGLGGAAANVYWFDAGNNTFWAPKETLIAIRCVGGSAIETSVAAAAAAAAANIGHCCDSGLPRRGGTRLPPRCHFPPSSLAPADRFLLFT